MEGEWCWDGGGCVVSFLNGSTIDPLKKKWEFRLIAENFSSMFTQLLHTPEPWLSRFFCKATEILGEGNCQSWSGSADVDDIDDSPQPLSPSSSSTMSLVGMMMGELWGPLVLPAKIERARERRKKRTQKEVKSKRWRGFRLTECEASLSAASLKLFTVSIFYSENRTTKKDVNGPFQKSCRECSIHSPFLPTTS